MSVVEAGYLQLAQSLIDHVEFAWDRIELHLEVYKNSTRDEVMAFSGDNEEQIFLPASHLFWDFHKTTSDTGKGSWYTCDFALYPDGRFTSNFGYEKTEWMKLVDDEYAKNPD